MSSDVNLKQLVELVGFDTVVNLLKEAAKKAGESHDWKQVTKISDFREALESEVKNWQQEKQ